KNVTGVSDVVLAAFDDYSFPGNVRELQYIIERAVILAQTGSIEIQHLPRRLSTFKNPKSPALNAPDPETPVPESAKSARPFLTLQEMEHQHILEALKTTEGNKSRAAEILGISRAALWRKLRIISQKEA
ncbi:MAG: hypothetical protein K9K87_08245, partial [Desulfotignum sp.]|nr:hypothetical protein [Desulfotignum sp.]